ncbi:MAG: hypothetical protein WB761_20360 [Solirubrobacteraceae bacterium]
MSEIADGVAVKLLLPTQRDREAHRKAVETLLPRNARLSDSDENA